MFQQNSSMSSKLRNSFKLKKLGFGKRNSSPSQPSASTADSDEPLDEEPIPTYEPVSLKKRKLLLLYVSTTYNIQVVILVLLLSWGL